MTKKTFFGRSEPCKRPFLRDTHHGRVFTSLARAKITDEKCPKRLSWQRIISQAVSRSIQLRWKFLCFAVPPVDFQFVLSVLLYLIAFSLPHACNTFSISRSLHSPSISPKRGKTRIQCRWFHRATYKRCLRWLMLAGNFPSCCNFHSTKRMYQSSRAQKGGRRSASCNCTRVCLFSNHKNARPLSCK